MGKWEKIGVMGLMGAFLLLSSSSAWAKVKSGGMPAGLAKGQKKGWHGGTAPPGWSHGKKKGWGDSGMPPGLAKKKGEFAEKELKEKEEKK